MGGLMVPWKLGEILWGGFDASKVGREIVPIVKGANRVENNTGEYCKYLKKILVGNAHTRKEIEQGTVEEVRHAGC